ncbi:3-deoxy-D-manno-octulosonic acid transferase [Alcaligenes sp. SDU_A2]|uniref:3-deoxy-D-manno-octulosonic acid transferase n=1 Tax=Alcaligenes sp. SDU_A2 TaxID=3136634 RepID=UPI002D1596CB|nr:3-deoxy-D-manno-octulosonic acid transferase [Alcaligenes sp.]HRL27859.1 3-deoxy-D-manno-octulosonic acid transferase [Alcaligenes sp.]
MNRFFYTTSIRLLAPALMAWMGLRARRAGGDWQVLSGPRFGYYGGQAVEPKAPVWVHAVSLGETRAAHPLIRALLDQGETVLLTHMTVTGRAEGANAFAADIEQGRVIQQWLPYDFPGAVRRFLAHYRPCAGVLIEREVWPNLLAAARRQGIPMMLASARFSEHALATSLRSGSVMREAYRSFELVYAQSLADAQRLEQAGAQGVRVSGNLKFDVDLPHDKIARGRRFSSDLNRRVVVIASTRETEDMDFADAIAHFLRREREHGSELHSPILFVLIPRHPQRFEEAAAYLDKLGLRYVRRSVLLQQGDSSTSAIQACRDVDVLLGDTLGEMYWYYALARVAIVAGSFQPLGGQNFIEASAIGVPVIVGPHTRNFEQAVQDALHAGAVVRAATPVAALQQAVELVDAPARHHKMSDAGLHWVQMHEGAVLRVLSGLAEIRGHKDSGA